MNFLQKIIEWLSFKPGVARERGHPDLYPIDTDKIKKELNLEAEAERLGKEGIPRADAYTYTGIEGKIIQVVDKARQDYVAWGSDRLKVLNQDIAGLDITPLANKILQADKAFEDDANAMLSAESSTLRSLYERFFNIEKEYILFRDKNKLIRDANFPSSSKAFFLWASLILMMLIEGIANAVFFAQGISGGLIQGFFYAAGSSFANVFSAFLIGRFLINNINHISYIRRFIGFISVLSAIILAVSMGLAIAHLRDALSSESQDAAKAAIFALKYSTFNLSDIFSWLLFSISIIFALLAVLDGYKMDDAYPGYGKITRRLLEARDDYDEEMSVVRENLVSIKEKAINQLEEDNKLIKSSLNRLNEAILHKESSGKRLSLAFQDAENCAFTLIKNFQDVNQIHRGGVPVPPYFGQDPGLKPIEILSFSVEEDYKKYHSQTELSRDVDDQIQNIKSNIVASYNKTHDSVRPLETHSFPGSEGYLK